MKTAISVPDETFRRVNERAAQLGLNRSEFFATAAERYLAELDETTLVAQIDAALARGGASVVREQRAAAELGADRLAALTADDEW